MIRPDIHARFLALLARVDDKLARGLIPYERPQTSRFHYADLDKAGNYGGESAPLVLGANRKRRR